MYTDLTSYLRIWCTQLGVLRVRFIWPSHSDVVAAVIYARLSNSVFHGRFYFNRILLGDTVFFLYRSRDTRANRLPIFHFLFWLFGLLVLFVLGNAFCRDQLPKLIAGPHGCSGDRQYITVGRELFVFRILYQTIN